MAPLFITLSMLTNIATSLAFGKPYTGVYIGLVVFAVLIGVCVSYPGLWDWSEKFALTIIPFVYASQYYWIGWVRRRRPQ
jgi:low affinity Fe/Cu permease